MDRVGEWRLFVSVASLGSFIEAARAHSRSPQSVTRAVAALEKRLGTRLLNRTTRSVSLTGEGERYLERSRRALAEFDLLEAPSDARAELRGTLSVTASVLFGQLHLVPVVAEFLEAHPQLDLRLTLLDRVVSLAEEGMDLGVRIGALSDSALRARGVGHVRSILCASPAYLKRAGVPKEPEALARHACIAFTTTTPIADRWSFPSGGRRERGVAVHPRLIVNTAQAAIEAALAGVGLVRVLSYQVDSLLADKRLRVVLEPFESEPVPVHLVHLPGPQRRAAAAFLDFAAERLRKRIGSRA
ncbi:LysR family transcriptional regulator [Corallococcus terminator]|uniref:LysR family transcriptional regulator n=1 Tax=Corallococcus terminator TaxID=2316733 RepID=A0A3A8J634_9BACT|nr:LysR family transcriptional regulator [Corallococcus terminator]RKG91119.1 LysR family transcriptional regulator [Corallococcus terminator]